VQQPPDEQLEAEGWPLEITSLRAATEKAVERGAVIVAAAGNQTEPPDPPMPMQLPGRYPHVIGVAASNIEDQAACYTNVGDVGAPGADGRYPGEATCEPRAIECSATDADCPLGVISLGRDPAGSYFYQFWAGSSFAAPLVSGQAAVLRSNTSGESPFDIMDTIYASAVQVPTTPNPFTHGLSLNP
jgi:subtilisin family serine protease